MRKYLKFSKNRKIFDLLAVTEMLLMRFARVQAKGGLAMTPFFSFSSGYGPTHKSCSSPVSDSPFWPYLLLDRSTATSSNKSVSITNLSARSHLVVPRNCHKSFLQTLNEGFSGTQFL